MLPLVFTLVNLRLNRNILPILLRAGGTLITTFSIVGEDSEALPLKVEPFDQAVHTAYDHRVGLVPEIRKIACGDQNEAFAVSADAVFRLKEKRWEALNDGTLRRGFVDCILMKPTKEERIL